VGTRWAGRWPSAASSSKVMIASERWVAERERAGQQRERGDQR
jgi:hypothetical protein